METDGGRVLTREQASHEVHELGWRLVLGELRTLVPVPSFAAAAEVARVAVEAAGDDAAGHLRVDLRADAAVLSLGHGGDGRVTVRDVVLAAAISDALREKGFTTERGTDRPVQVVELGIDALDIDAVRPFWRAVLNYDEDNGALVDPRGQGISVWFQQMDEPRTERNRLHLDVSVPHDEAEDRVRAAIAAGGRLLTSEHAPAFWVLADPEGNEACVTTWQGRD